MMGPASHRHRHEAQNSRNDNERREDMLALLCQRHRTPTMLMMLMTMMMIHDNSSTTTNFCVNAFGVSEHTTQQQQRTAQMLLNPQQQTTTPAMLFNGRRKHAVVVRPTREAPFCLGSSRQTTESRTKTDRKEQQKEEEDLSDVDARVLRSMLQDQKIDTSTEGDVRKLLERGTVKTTTTKQDFSKKDDDDSMFSSTVIKTVTNTNLWKSLQAQANDMKESIGIWVSNKVEQDVKVLAALGIFAWDRIVKDVSRALPAAGNSAANVVKVTMALTNSSSYNDEAATAPKTAFQAENEITAAAAADEIKSVTREVFEILKGETVSTTSSNTMNGNSAQAAGRGLRTAAPAGAANAAERQTRAFVNRKKQMEQEKDVTKIGGGFIDTAYELQREISAETNTPGYRSEPVLDAIEASVASAGNVLRAAQDQARLAASQRRKEQLLLENNESVEAATTGETAFFTEDDTVVNGQHATEVKGKLNTLRAKVLERLDRCINVPDETWLTPAMIDSCKTDVLTDKSTQDLMTNLIVTNEELKAAELDVQAVQQALTELEQSCVASRSISVTIEGSLRAVLFPECRQSLVEQVAEIQRQLVEEEAVSVNGSVSIPEEIMTVNAVVETMDPVVEVQPTSQFSHSNAVVVEPEMVEFVPNKQQQQPTTTHNTMESEVEATMNNFAANGAAAEPSRSQTVSVFAVAEIVTDETFDSAFGEGKTELEDAGVNDGQLDVEEEEKEPSLVKLAVLRSLDVIFFILEKALLSVPGTIAATQTAIVRVGDVQRDGRGKEGWKQLGNLADTKGRY